MYYISNSGGIPPESPPLAGRGGPGTPDIIEQPKEIVDL